MYKVVHRFIDLEDNNRLYEVGDIYPTADKTKERIDFLKSDKNKIGVPVIKYSRDKKTKD